MTYHLVAQEFCILLLQAQAVVILILVPVLQLNHHIDLLGLLHALDAEQGLHIHDADAAQLDEMLRDLRRASHQRVVADLVDLHHIVRHQTVSALNQLQSRLALSDAALAHDQHALTVHIHQHAMDRNPGSQLHIQPINNRRHEIRRGLVRQEHGNLILVRQLQGSGLRPRLGGINHAGNAAGKEILVNRLLLLIAAALQIRIFYKAYDLHPF